MALLSSSHLSSHWKLSPSVPPGSVLSSPLLSSLPLTGLVNFTRGLEQREIIPYISRLESVSVSQYLDIAAFMTCNIQYSSVCGHLTLSKTQNDKFPLCFPPQPGPTDIQLFCFSFIDISQKMSRDLLYNFHLALIYMYQSYQSFLYGVKSKFVNVSY